MDFASILQLIFKLAPGVIAAIEAALAGGKASAAELPPEAIELLKHVVQYHKAQTK